MSVIGVDYGATTNLFNTGQSLGASLASAFGGAGSMKRQLMEDQHQKNLAYIEAAGAKSALDRQEYGGRNDLSRAAADIARAHAQGTSNAGSAGAAPAPVDINDARSRFAGAQQLLATGANDSAVGLNHTLGGLGMAFGPKTQFRENVALTGGSPTAGNVYGPWDNVGTNATIAVEGAKTQGRIQQDAADVPNKIAIDAAKQEKEKSLLPSSQTGPFGKSKEMENIIYELEPKMRNGTATPEEKRLFNIAMGQVNPSQNVETTTPNGQKRIDRIDGNKLPLDISINPYAPPPTAPPAVVTMPGAPAPAAPTPPPAPTVQSTITVGEAKPLEAGVGTARTRFQALTNAEQILGGVKTPVEAPDLIQQLIESPTDDNRINLLKKLSSDPRYREFMTAASNYLTEVLRDESGAAIGSSEFWRRATELIPFSSDTPEAIAYKRAERTNKLYGQLDKGWGEGDPEKTSILDGLEKEGRGRATRKYQVGASRGAGGKKHWTTDADGNPVLVGE